MRNLDNKTHMGGWVGEKWVMGGKHQEKPLHPKNQPQIYILTLKHARKPVHEKCVRSFTSEKENEKALSEPHASPLPSDSAPTHSTRIM